MMTIFCIVILCSTNRLEVTVKAQLAKLKIHLSPHTYQDVSIVSAISRPPPSAGGRSTPSPLLRSDTICHLVIKILSLHAQQAINDYKAKFYVSGDLAADWYLRFRDIRHTRH
jgi:hypothetical protein